MSMPPPTPEPTNIQLCKACDVGSDLFARGRVHVVSSAAGATSLSNILAKSERSHDV